MESQWAAPAIAGRCATLDVAAFVDEHGDCVVQESRYTGGPADFVLTRLRDFFRRHPPSLAIATLSKRRPCVAQELAFGGPDSGTPVAHSHGIAELQLLAGEKEWWLWPPQASPLIELVMRGAQAKNRLELWREHIAPLFEHAHGDVTTPVLQSLRALVDRGLLVPSPPRAAGESAAYVAACACMRRWRSERRGIVAEHHRATVLVQRAGEALVVPEGWPHAVRNRGWSLAVIHELLRAELADAVRRTA